MAEEPKDLESRTKPTVSYSNEEDTDSLKSVDDSEQDWTPKKYFGLQSTQLLNQLVEVTQAVNPLPQKESEFSSLLYISKRLNQEKSCENPNTAEISEIVKDIEEAKDFSKTTEKTKDQEASAFEDMSNEECLGYISIRTQNQEDNDFLAIDDSHSEWIQAFKKLHSNITERPLLVDRNENIHLCIDLEKDEDRELITALTKIKLPEIYTLKISNFYEGDEELESFLSQSLTSVWNFLFLSESYWVDFHDYLESLTSIPSIKHLYLKGFLIDSDDYESLLGNASAQKLSFESCNVAVEEDFSIPSDESVSKGTLPVLRSISFIDNEMDEESMRRMLTAIKNSNLAGVLKEVTVRDCSLTQQQVQSIIE